MATVYIIKDPRDGSIFYVGATRSTLDCRLGGHMQEVRRGSTTATYRLMAEIMAEGHDLKLEAVEECSDELLGEREQKYIDSARALGQPLTNKNKGGAGLNKGPVSEKGRRNISEGKTAMWNGPEGESRRRTQSQVMLAKFADPEFKAKWQAANLAVWAPKRAARFAKKAKAKAARKAKFQARRDKVRELIYQYDALTERDPRNAYTYVSENMPEGMRLGPAAIPRELRILGIETAAKRGSKPKSQKGIKRYPYGQRPARKTKNSV